MSRLNPARLLAARVGAEVRKRNAFTSEVLDSMLQKTRLSSEDNAFARVLSLGVTSTAGTLDEVIDRALRDPSDVKDDVRDCLRVSTYEILYLDKADHAAVDQGVELVRSIQPKASRLANAVLRKILTSRKQFPFGDPASDDAALARLFGFPLWLAQELITWFGREEAARFMHVSNQQAPVFFGVNALRVTQDEVCLDSLAREGVRAGCVRFSDKGEVIPGCYRAENQAAVATRAAKDMFRGGQLLVSDAAAQAIALLALPDQFPDRFLEVGAGRGTKTILMQSGAQRRWGRQMDLTCLDAHGFKASLLQDRVSRYGVIVTDTICADARRLPNPESDNDELGMFDAIFLDAPCSGLGTLRRHPEIRWRLTPDQIKQMAELSLKMLEGVSSHLKVGGRLVFATCTVSPEENEMVLKSFLESRFGSESFRIEPCPINSLSKLFMKTRLVDGGCDAHFAAVLRRVK